MQRARDLEIRYGIQIFHLSNHSYHIEMNICREALVIVVVIHAVLAHLVEFAGEDPIAIPFATRACFDPGS